MSDWKQTGRLRYLVEATLWGGFLVLVLAVGISVGQKGQEARRPAASSPAEYGLSLQPRLIEDPEVLEQLRTLNCQL